MLRLVMGRFKTSAYHSDNDGWVRVRVRDSNIYHFPHVANGILDSICYWLLQPLLGSIWFCDDYSSILSAHFFIAHNVFDAAKSFADY